MKPLLYLTILLLSSSLLYGQDKIVFESDAAEAEFDVALNPIDSNNIIVATMRGFDDVENSFLTVYYTSDFGGTWEVSDFTGKHNGQPGSGDPVLSFDAEGNAYLVNLVVTEDFEISTILSKSTDGGKTWSLFATYNEFTDKPWLEVDQSDVSPYKGNIYVPIVEEELVLLTYGSDGSLKNKSSVSNGVQIPSVVVGNDGDVYTSNITFDDPMEIYFQHWTDEGKTLVSERSVAEFPDYTFNASDISTRFQPAPYLAIDNSGGVFEGRLYLAFTASETSGEDFFNVFLTFSDDKGITWSAPKPIHSDLRSNVQQFYSSIFVNVDGVLIMDWYDRTNYGPFSSETDFFMGISSDGGATIKTVKLNTKSMDFDVASIAGFGFGVGEYHQCVATKSEAVSFWSDGRKNDGDLNIYFAKVDLENPISDVKELGLIQDKINISNPYPLPTNNNLFVDLKLKKAYSLKYTVTDLSANVLSQTPFKEYSTGEHKISIVTPQLPGIYLLNVYSNTGYVKQVKFIRI